VTGLVGTLLEAWGEVRVHRSRVVLSLVGVFLAVFAMTGITAAGDMGRQAVLEADERRGGRSTTLSVSGGPTTGSATTADTARVYAAVTERFGITWSSTVQQTGGQLDLPQGSVYYNGMVVQPAYGTIHRVSTAAGRWFVDGDAQRMSPAVVVSRAFLEQAQLPDRAPPFSFVAPGTTPVTVTVIGVVAGDPYNPVVYSLPDGPQWQPLPTGQTPALDVWVPPARATEIARGIEGALRAQGWAGDATPQNSPETAEALRYLQWGIRAVSLFALALGALGVLNVGIVTVRQRVREIGVRRALGASSTRVFMAIMLESVVATALAGALGVALAVAIVVNLPLELVLGQLGIADVPPFPVRAAVEAFVSATAIGALVGLVPATIAVRSKVIDAIRY
jgi:putative ABC transport system permease protein